jgi:hypothetical protein
MVLESASNIVPGPPPDFAKEMDELRNFKQNFSIIGNAFHYASQNTGADLLHKKYLSTTFI